MLGELTRGLELLNKATEAFRTTGDIPDLTRTLVWRASVKRCLGQYQASLADADEALTLPESSDNMYPLQADA